VAKGNVSFDAAMVYGAVLRRVDKVVNKAGRIALGSARERAPVRKIFKGGRQSAPRFYTLPEAKAELPAFLRSMGQNPNARARAGQMTKSEAMTQLLRTPISTSRNRANSWQRTGTVSKPTAPYRRRALDDLRQPRKDKDGNSIFVTLRSIEATRPGLRLFDRSAESELTSRGRYELKHALRRKSISFGQSAKAEGSLHDEVTGKPTPGSEGQLGGHLRKSIEMVIASTADHPKVSIVAGGDDAPYARFVEFGTRHAAAQPFLRPALKHVEGPYKAMMRDAFPGAK
jgi:HK97 gp10 family phage protein